MRQQDQQRMRELQQTLAELEKSEREMATERHSRAATAQRLTRSTLSLQNNSQTDTAQASSTEQVHKNGLLLHFWGVTEVF